MVVEGQNTFRWKKKEKGNVKGGAGLFYTAEQR